MRHHQLRYIAVAAQDYAAEQKVSIVIGAGSGGDAGQLTRSPGNSSASLPYVVTVDSALALAQLLQPSLAFCCSYNKMLLVVAAITFKF